MRGMNGTQCPFDPAQLLRPPRSGVKQRRYLTAYGFTGEPTPPVIGNAGAQNMNS
jgi:hypothetical protein